MTPIELKVRDCLDVVFSKMFNGTYDPSAE